MQTKIIAAIVVASITITSISCDWFTSSTPSKNLQTNIIGKWKVDSIYQNDTSLKKNDLSGIFVGLMALAMTDSNHHFYQFNPDSTWNKLSLKDSTVGKYYIQDSTLFIQEDTTFIPNKIIAINDSLLSFKNKENLIFQFKKLSIH